MTGLANIFFLNILVALGCAPIITMFPPDATLYQVADVLNHQAHSYRIGKLQAIRKSLKGLKRRASGPIFSQGSVHEHFAFHSGAQGELQFNIGFEYGEFRHGVAFSFETSRSFPKIDGLIEKVRYFNEYIEENPKIFEGLGMWEWHEEPGKRSAVRAPQPIRSESIKNGRFIFIGSIGSLGKISADDVLRDFDRLLDLYVHVESYGAVVSGDQPPSGHMSTDPHEVGKFVTPVVSWKSGFRPGHTPYPRLATASFSERTVEVSLRHNYLQSLIFSALEAEFGVDHVATEQRSASGGEIDFVIRTGHSWILAELKISSRAIWCIRDSIGQLLEYGYFKESHPADELWVIGVGVCSGEDEKYLKTLRSQLNIPLFYRQFDELDKTLGPRI